MSSCRAASSSAHRPVPVTGPPDVLGDVAEDRDLHRALPEPSTQAQRLALQPHGRHGIVERGDVGQRHRCPQGDVGQAGLFREIPGTPEERARLPQPSLEERGHAVDPQAVRRDVDEPETLGPREGDVGPLPGPRVLAVELQDLRRAGEQPDPARVVAEIAEALDGGVELRRRLFPTAGRAQGLRAQRDRPCQRGWIVAGLAQGDGLLEERHGEIGAAAGDRRLAGLLDQVGAVRVVGCDLERLLEEGHGLQRGSEALRAAGGGPERDAGLGREGIRLLTLRRGAVGGDVVGGERARQLVVAE